MHPSAKSLRKFKSPAPTSQAAPQSPPADPPRRLVFSFRMIGDTPDFMKTSVFLAEVSGNEREGLATDPTTGIATIPQKSARYEAFPGLVFTRGAQPAPVYPKPRHVSNRPDTRTPASWSFPRALFRVAGFLCI